MWQLATILEFLHVFSAQLRISDTFTPEELEVAIVSEAGQTGMLANLHQVSLHILPAHANQQQPSGSSGSVWQAEAVTSEQLQVAVIAQAGMLVKQHMASS